jgi:hypothetical protein
MGAPPRPIDPGFKEYALTHGVAETKQHFSLGTGTMRRWVIECGIADEITARQGKPAQLRPMPEDFPIYAGKETNDKLRDRFTCGEALILRWRRECGIKSPSNAKETGDAPANFVALAANLYRYEAAQRFGVSGYKLARWVRETGAKFKQRKPYGAVQQSLIPPADDSMAGRAAQHLRRLMPVYQASILDKKRTGHVVGGRHMETQDMITMAQKRGFNPRGWEAL